MGHLFTRVGRTRMKTIYDFTYTIKTPLTTFRGKALCGAKNLTFHSETKDICSCPSSNMRLSGSILTSYSTNKRYQKGH